MVFTVAFYSVKFVSSPFAERQIISIFIIGMTL